MRRLVLWVIAAAVTVCQTASAQSNVAAEPVVGLRENTPKKYALRNAHVVTAPGNILEKADVLISGTSIVAVGSQLDIPAGYMSIDCEGQTIYPGLIDAYSDREVPKPDQDTAGHWNSNITPERSAHESALEGKSEFEKLRSQGITARVIAPRHGIIKGNSCVVLTSDDPTGRVMLKQKAWQHLSLTVPRNKPRSTYPNSPMGAVALLRQTLYDANWYDDAWNAYGANPKLPRPETNLSLDHLGTEIKNSWFVIDAPNERMALRASSIAKEFSIRVILRGSGREYRELESIAANGHPVLVPVNFEDKPQITNDSDAQEMSLRDLMHWDLSPENPARLGDSGAVICLTTDGLDDTKKFLKQIRTAVSRGLSAEAALAALTISPAKLLGIDGTAGQIRPGMLANLIVADGDLFDSETKLLQTWVAGKQFVHAQAKSKNPDALVGRWSLTFSDQSKATELFLEIEQKNEKLVGQIVPTENAPAEETVGDDENENKENKKASLKDVTRQARRLTANFRLSDLADQYDSGVSQLTLIQVDEGNDRPTLLGSMRLPNGEIQRLLVSFVAEDQASDSDPKDDGQENDENDSAETETAQTESPTPLVYPLGAYGRLETVASPPHALFRNATIWTCGNQGIISNADILIANGKVVSVGQNLRVPKDCQIIDARGKHITPGLIDCHSHMGTDGGVNESGQAVTAEVRIGDFIDNSDINIYRQLAGGVTTSNILHGSANPIGGQNQVIKLRWGQSMEGLRMIEAPPGIKFALGENVKRNQSRYPNTRMGVEQIIRDQLLAAREYDRSWRDYRKGIRNGLPPRRDLQLDAMAEVQRRQRWIHCHSYRQDEIVATLDLLDEFGIQIGTLQHILEGYKVADRMAKHGAMASAFSDWWAYKFEVFDAIPYNGALMHNQGIVVSFNSDDREIGRHLNTEAAKAVKYGGVSEEDALKFVTLNPARQLRIDKHVGSLEPNKDADLVIWSGPPLSTMSRCEQTWIDGKQYFDLESDRKMRQRDARLHAALVQKILDDDRDEKPRRENNDDVDEEDRWARHDVFCTANGEDGHKHSQWEKR